MFLKIIFQSINLIQKVHEDFFIYLSATVAPLIIIDWGQVLQGIIISCASGTIPLFIKHWYRNNYPGNKNDNNE